MKYLKAAENLKGKKVLVRCDFNVPLGNGEVQDDYRIKRALPTLDFLKQQGAKTILVSHFEDSHKKVLTLRPVHTYLQKVTSGLFFAGGFSELEEITKAMLDGQTVLLENVRFWEGEKANDEVFAKRLASFGDIFVNEAFSESHRRYASIVGVPRFIPGYAGFLFEEEIKHLAKAFSPTHPFTFILGGAKFETKLPLVKKFLEKADSLMLGGALANDFYKAQGLEVGNSLVSKNILPGEILKHPKVIVPEDVVIVTPSGERVTKSVKAILPGEIIKDAGPGFLKRAEEIIKKAQFILWNGPFGTFEEGFGEATLKLAEMIAQSSGETILGGGDTLAAIKKIGFDKFTFISTGGGAMLDYLATGTLPGIEALTA